MLARDKSQCPMSWEAVEPLSDHCSPTAKCPKGSSGVRFDQTFRSQKCLGGDVRNPYQLISDSGGTILPMAIRKRTS